MARKKTKIKQKRDELPSFLLNLKNITDNAKVWQKSEKSGPHMGPIFFGCRQYHPQPHSLNLGSFHYTQYTASSKENLLSGLFLPKSTVEKVHEVRSFHPVIKPRRKVFTDLNPPKYKGTLKVFKPEVSPPVIDVGETVSIIETEISREIPLCWVERASSGSLEKEFELVTLSDVLEKKRKKNELPYKERIAHTHFPKEFVTVRVVGPPIPGAITITKLPSKRKTDSEISLHLSSGRKSTEKVEKREEVEKVDVVGKRMETFQENAVSVEEEVSLIEEVEINDNKEEESADIIEEDDVERVSEENLSDTDEGNAEKKQKSVTFEENEGEKNLEEMGIESNTQEEGGEENPTEEVPEE